MLINLKGSREVEVRLFESRDEPNLFKYFEALSPQTKSRYGPHPFDRQTIHEICLNPAEGIKRYVAVDPATEAIVAYMLMKDGMIEGDVQRFAERGTYFDNETTATFAPSIADSWQSEGLGTAMYNLIENDLKKEGKKTIVLWAGVQASNVKAFQYYTKLGFIKLSSFMFNDIDNYDMIKSLNHDSLD